MIMSELHRRIKYAVAKELVEVGYTAGVDVPISEGGFVDVQGRKGNDVLNIEVWKTQLPDWLIVRVKEAIKASTDSETQGNTDPAVLYENPYSEVSKLKLFKEIFNTLTGVDKNDVSKRNFIDELINTGKFTEAEVEWYLRKAIQNDQIFERKSGMLAKT